MPIALPPEHLAASLHMIGGHVTGELVNTMAFDLTNRTEPVVQTVFDAIAGNWQAKVASQLCNDITMTHVSGIYHDPVLGPVVLDSTQSLPATGNVTSTMMPLNSAIIVQKNTAFAGRKFRGRMFLGGFPMAFMDSDNPNEIAAATKASLQSNWDTFHTFVEAQGALCVLLHQETGPTPTRVTAFEVHALIATMRKRIR